MSPRVQLLGSSTVSPRVQLLGSSTVSPCVQPLGSSTVSLRVQLLGSSTVSPCVQLLGSSTVSPCVQLLGSSTVSPCVQLFKAYNSTYLPVTEYPCTPVLLGGHVRPHCSKCPLSDTKPSDSCGPVNPAPYDNRSHVAVVPCTNSCSLEEKAQNLGQANYAVFIIWKNCSASELVNGLMTGCWCSAVNHDS